MGSVLSPAQISEFIDRGFVTLEQAFATKTAISVCRALETRLEVSMSDPGTWPLPRITIADVMREPPFTDAVTDRLRGALDDLLGAGSWSPVDCMGWWQITFPGFATIDYGDDWHVDGRSFVHHPWSPELRLFPLFLFTDIEPSGGGTLLDVGSHRRVAQVLWEHEPGGIPCDDLSRMVAALPDSRGEVVEATGRAGDVVLCHPMIFHSSNRNRGAGPRVQATPHVAASAVESYYKLRSPVARPIANARRRPRCSR